MQRMIKNVVFTVLLASSGTVHARGIVDQLLKAGLAHLPNSVLQKGMREIAPYEAEQLEGKIAKLHKQCRILQKRGYKKKRSRRYKQRHIGFSSQFPKSMSSLQVVKTRKLKGLKNDHKNAEERAGGMEEYLMAVSDEVSTYLANPDKKPMFVREAILRLESSGVQKESSLLFVFKGLQSLINFRLLPDVRSIKTSIQKGQYKECSEVAGEYVSL